MDKILRHTKFLLLSGLMTVSAVGASAVTAGLMSKKDLETLNSLGPHQKPFPSYNLNSYKLFKQDKKQFAVSCLNILANNFLPLNGALRL
jgi:hypothetical protein